MRSTLKDVLFRCLNALKKASAHREKWLTEWPGQVRGPAQTAPPDPADGEGSEKLVSCFRW